MMKRTKVQTLGKLHMLFDELLKTADDNSLVL